MANPAQSILVTGASTGIGFAITLDLASSGHQVFASVRKKTDADRLIAASPRIIPVIFDVTDGSAIREAVIKIRAQRSVDNAFSIINNAGVAVAGPLEDLPLKELRRQFDINVFGVHEVTQSFLPLVRERKGRIVNMSSISGLLASPFLGPYSASKFALEAMTDSLRYELAAEGIKVLLIEPGPIQTPIWEKNITVPDFPISERYRIPLERFIRMVKKISSSSLPPEYVVKAVRRALFTANPPERQVVTGIRSRLELELARKIPPRFIERQIISRLWAPPSK